MSGSLQNLHRWWDDLLSLGQDYGYFIYASKCWLLLKDSVNADVNIFAMVQESMFVLMDGVSYWFI